MVQRKFILLCQRSVNVFMIRKKWDVVKNKFVDVLISLPSNKQNHRQLWYVHVHDAGLCEITIQFFWGLNTEKVTKTGFEFRALQINLPVLYQLSYLSSPIIYRFTFTNAGKLTALNFISAINKVVDTIFMTTVFLSVVIPQQTIHSQNVNHFHFLIFKDNQNLKCSQDPGLRNP